MSAINPQLLLTFSTVVSTGSISAAAGSLGVGKSVVSRQLARLEAELGMRLVQRTTRKLSLTEVGKVVLAQAQHIERAVSNVAHISGEAQKEVRGPLRVACPRPLGQLHLVPLITEFVRLHPLVKITLLVEDRLMDLVTEQIDVAIRMAHLEDSTLVARKLTDNPRVLVAAPSYLARAGTPSTPDQLADHECVLWTQNNRVFDEWPLSRGNVTTRVRVQGRICINDGMALVASACSGAGITVLDRLLATHELASGELIELLPDYQLPPGPPIHAVFPARQWLARNTATFVEFLLNNGVPVVPASRN